MEELTASMKWLILDRTSAHGGQYSRVPWRKTCNLKSFVIFYTRTSGAAGALSLVPSLLELDYNNNIMYLYSPW